MPDSYAVSNFKPGSYGIRRAKRRLTLKYLTYSAPIIIIVLITTIGAFDYYHNFLHKSVKLYDVINSTLLLALAAYWVGYGQWLSVRREASLEKFYDRLDIANRRIISLIERGVDGKDPKMQEPNV